MAPGDGVACVAKPGSDSVVVGDHKQRAGVCAPIGNKQIKHRLGGKQIEPGCNFVEDEKRRFHSQGAHQCQPPLFAAGKATNRRPKQTLVEANTRHEQPHTLSAIGRRKRRKIAQRFFHIALAGPGRIERAAGILKHSLQMLPPFAPM